MDVVTEPGLLAQEPCTLLQDTKCQWAQTVLYNNKKGKGVEDSQCSKEKD